METKIRFYKIAVLLSILMIYSCKKSPSNAVVVLPPAYKPGETVYGSKNYTRFIVGDNLTPFILSSPHDGDLTPSNIPDRTQGVTVTDINVTDLTLRLADSIKKVTGLRPHVVINDLKRTKLDPNRSLSEAFLTHADATLAYNDYHGFIKSALKIVSEKVGKGLYFDMHGHGHTKSRIEIGYLLSATQLNGTDVSLDNLGNYTSIKAIAKYSTLPFWELIRGSQSLGTLLTNAGCPSVPSQQDPKPLNDDYFNGGYCTSSYGSLNGGNISAIQLETPGPIIRNTSVLRQQSAGKMARVMNDYLRIHYQIILP
jgi:hypothetical protein